MMLLDVLLVKSVLHDATENIDNEMTEAETDES